MNHLLSFIPRAEDFSPFRKSFRANQIAGVTVGIVALPLALGFAITTCAGA